ncbi:Regulator of telomere elongation helicase 1 homolog [Gryllus bimaculatus]|nr:Regulator of telomere elongation helicase 1 homolog [Gryllus bimaculatus]
MYHLLRLKVASGPRLARFDQTNVSNISVGDASCGGIAPATSCATTARDEAPATDSAAFACARPIAASTPQCGRGKPTPDASALGDGDDDDFVSLPRRRSTHASKRARLDCGDGPCCSTSCVGDSADDRQDPDFSATVGPARSPCGRPLTDIEDMAVPDGNGPKRELKRLPSSWGSGDIFSAEESDEGPPRKSENMSPKAKQEVIDLVSESENSNDSEESQTESESSQAPQEVLSQAFWGGAGDRDEDDDEGEDAPWHFGARITREGMRSVLRGRTREPTAGGEYGPTRRLSVPRARAPIKVPKIFYASRTHLQLEQVANEIKRTHYCDARVVVLSSREFTCINDQEFRTKKYPNRTDMCRQLLNDVPLTDTSWTENRFRIDESSSKSTCFYFSNSKRYATHDAMEAINVGPVVDINNLVQAGRRHKFCPYFAARNLITTADIILCPVNYLIDPLVRKSMNMELKGEIIVIDEAHMLDDLCRETASMIVPVSELKECAKDCFALVDRQQLPHAHRTMADFLQAVISWIDMNSQRSLSYGFNNEKEFSVSSIHLIASLEQSQITREGVSKFKHPDDYVGSITLTNKYDPESSFNSRKEQEWAIKLVCQNAGLIFNTLSSVTRSIIFSSATLSPLSAFAAELDIKIPNTCVRGHVIPPMQTWIGCLGRSGNGHELYGRYSNTKTVEYMDEIGNIVLDVCVRVPYGVLVFVAAYWTLENIIQRWKDTGLWTKIGEHKRPFSETRRAKDFNEVLKDFYNAVEDAQESIKSGLVTVGNGCTGPLLVAVMRGKVSEGFNFADDKTRAIITVGIPYPNVHEDTVRWKREYNKLHALSKPLQDAEGWYNTQAFRALSQSLGRGLRHRQDWCLLLLLDARFQQPKYSQLLPQWMYERMINYRQYTGMLSSMEDYLKRMKLLSDNSKS